MNQFTPLQQAPCPPWHASAWWRTLRTACWFLPLVHIGYPSLVPWPQCWEHVRLPAPARRAGYGLAVLGSMLTTWSVWTLVRPGQGTPAPHDPPLLFVSTGPYRLCRNPMEQGNVLILLGRALASGSPRLAIASVLFATSIHVWVVLVEEPGLHQRFGAQYAAYVRRVPRWGWTITGRTAREPPFRNTTPSW
jgi:protein-S-isoprenylcysteine O-methyltransferase Ste14